LPLNSFFGVDEQMNILKNKIKFTTTPEMNIPVIITADKDGNILFISTGYRIGIGEQILKYLK